MTRLINRCNLLLPLSLIHIMWHKTTPTTPTLTPYWKNSNQNISLITCCLAKYKFINVTHDGYTFQTHPVHPLHSTYSFWWRVTGWWLFFVSFRSSSFFLVCYFLCFSQFYFLRTQIHLKCNKISGTAIVCVILTLLKAPRQKVCDAAILGARTRRTWIVYFCDVYCFIIIICVCVSMIYSIARNMTNRWF